MKLARPNLFMDCSFPVVQQKTSADVDLPPFRLGNADSGGQKARHDKPPCRSSDHRRAAEDRNLSCVERHCQSPAPPTTTARACDGIEPAIAGVWHTETESGDPCGTRNGPRARRISGPDSSRRRDATA